MVRQLLGSDGPFRFDLIKTPLGAQFFGQLSQADPRSGLACLQRGFDGQTMAELKAIRAGRRHLVQALEDIIVWRELFRDGARLLLALGEAETETWANNASGVFAGLFSPAPGLVASTEASPEERFPVLREAMTSSSKERRLLGIRACKAALTTRNFSRAVSSEPSPFKREPKWWQPKTYSEIFDHYHHVLSLLTDHLETASSDEQSQIVQIFLDTARDLTGIPGVADQVIDIFERLIGVDIVDHQEILRAIVLLLNYNSSSIDPPIVRRWEGLKARLEGADLHSQLRRYAGMDLIEDRFDENGVESNHTATKLQDLARKCLDDPSALERELPWLVTEEARNGYVFGNELGTVDDSFALLPLLVSAQRVDRPGRNVFFLGGYLNVVHIRSPELWEMQMSQLAADPETVRFVPELIWRSEALTDFWAERLLDLIRSGACELTLLRLFTVGRMIESLSEPVFLQWITFLLASSEDVAAPVALDLFHTYFIRGGGRPLTGEVTFQLLTHSGLLGQTRHSQTMIGYYWTAIGKQFLDEFPHRMIDITDRVLSKFGIVGDSISSPRSQAMEVLLEVMNRFPEDVWRTAAKYIGPPIDARALEVREWLRGGLLMDQEGPSPLSFVPAEALWAWVDEDVNRRSGDLASYVPNDLLAPQNDRSIMREVLVRYGDNARVRGNTLANFTTGSWWGPQSTHLAGILQQLRTYEKTENNINVRRWIDESAEYLGQVIRQASAEEERED